MEIPEESLFQIEKSFLTCLIKQMKSNALSNEAAKDITSEFLSLMPFSTMEEAKSKVKDFSDKYPDFSPMYVVLLQHEDQHHTSGLLNQMRDLLHSNKIDEALGLVTK